MRFACNTFGALVWVALLSFWFMSAGPAGSSALAAKRDSLVVAQTKPKKKPAQKEVKRTTTRVNYDGWVVTCVKRGEKDKENCVARFTVVGKKKKRTLMSWRVGMSKSDLLMSELVTPTGVRIEPGVELLIDDKLPVKNTYTSCGPRGCMARFPISKELQSSLARAKKVSVKVASTNGKIISFNLGFTGFAKALKDVTKK